MTGGSNTSPIGYAPRPSGRGPRDPGGGGRLARSAGWTRRTRIGHVSGGTEIHGRNRCLAAVAVGVSVGVLAGCGATDEPAAAPAPPPVHSAEAESPAVALPNLVGKGLQAAEDEAQAAGFFALTSHDALGQRRDQVLDREWTVCFQDPAPGSAPSSTLVVLGAVRLGETCPAADLGTAVAADEPADPTALPDVVGLSVAQAAVARVRRRDAARRHRRRAQRRRRPQLAGLRPGTRRGRAARGPRHAERGDARRGLLSPLNSRPGPARHPPPPAPGRRGRGRAARVPAGPATPRWPRCAPPGRAGEGRPGPTAG